MEAHREKGRTYRENPTTTIGRFNKHVTEAPEREARGERWKQYLKYQWLIISPAWQAVLWTSRRRNQNEPHVGLPRKLPWGILIP